MLFTPRLLPNRLDGTGPKVSVPSFEKGLPAFDVQVLVICELLDICQLNYSSIVLMASFTGVPGFTMTLDTL